MSVPELFRLTTWQRCPLCRRSVEATECAVCGPVVPEQVTRRMWVGGSRSAQRWVGRG